MHSPAHLPGQKYRGRLAPSPTGFLHLGHARTFWKAQERARQYGGELILRNEDLDRARCLAGICIRHVRGFTLVRFPLE